MKKIVAAMVAVTVLTLCSCSTNWENARYVEYKCPEGMRLLNTETIDSCEDVLETLGLTKENALNALKDGQMFFTSFLPQTDAEGKTTYPVEMFLMVDSADFAENIYDFNRLSEEELQKNIEMMMDTSETDKEKYNIESVTQTESNGIIFIQYDYSSVYNDETQYVTQYTTVYNGFLYNMFCISSVEMTDEIISARDELFGSIKFTEKIDAAEEYDPEYNLFSHTVSRFFKKNWLTVLVVSVTTIGLTVFFLVYHEKKKKNPDNIKAAAKKKDGVVRADYLK